MVKPQVNFQSRMNTDTAAASGRRCGRADDVFRDSPRKADPGLNRSFSVFVNGLAINAA
jgi:hypothetical protein